MMNTASAPPGAVASAIGWLPIEPVVSNVSW
jgi:hypothetical protein